MKRRRLLFLLLTSLLILTGGAARGVGGDMQDATAPPLLTESAWVLVMLGDQEQSSGPAITARFDPGGTIAGSDGCNRYRGGYVSDGSTLHISNQMATTMMACREPSMRRASAYAEVLGNTASFEVVDDRLILRNEAGDEIAIFQAERLGLRTAKGALALNLIRDDAAPSPTSSSVEPKIGFDLDRLDTNGLQGPPNGLRALHYEYCIPDREDAVRAVRSIDPTLQIQGGSPGRVGCGKEELLCLGHTNQQNHRAVLHRLAALSFVAEIREAVFE